MVHRIHITHSLTHASQLLASTFDTMLCCVLFCFSFSVSFDLINNISHSTWSAHNVNFHQQHRIQHGMSIEHTPTPNRNRDGENANTNPQQNFRNETEFRNFILCKLHFAHQRIQPQPSTAVNSRHK